LSFTGRVSADSPSATFPFQQQIFAGQGYLILMPNPRGSWGYGEQFRRRGRGDYGIGPYNDIMSGVDYVISTQDIADSEKVGIMGMAFDGYRTAYAITQTSRFKAASVGQIYGFNLASWYGQAPDIIGRVLGGAPWQAPQNYAPVSPVNFAGNLKTPTLIFHLAEPDCVAAQSREFYTALRQNNVPVEYVIYEQNQNEFGTTKLNQWKDAVQRNVDWFNRWLK
jgi:dipeptidyl aminopeptidase/acylaminoacyl peptidase